MGPCERAVSGKDGAMRIRGPEASAAGAIWRHRRQSGCMNEGQTGKFGIYNKSGYQFKGAVSWQESNAGKQE